LFIENRQIILSLVQILRGRLVKPPRRFRKITRDGVSRCIPHAQLELAIRVPRFSLLREFGNRDQSGERDLRCMDMLPGRPFVPFQCFCRIPFNTCPLFIENRQIKLSLVKILRSRLVKPSRRFREITRGRVARCIPHAQLELAIRVPRFSLLREIRKRG
jgi:hypothetical protein